MVLQKNAALPLWELDGIVGTSGDRPPPPVPFGLFWSQHPGQKLQEPLENQIADTVAASPAGLCGQLWLLRELIVANGQNDRDERIFRSLLIGIMQLGVAT